MLSTVDLLSEVKTPNLGTRVSIDASHEYTLDTSTAGYGAPKA
jgi:hypothetical protein